MDLFYFFFHLALNLLSSSGIGTYITTNYFPTAAGALKLRKDLNKRSTFLRLINFNEFKIFDSALGQNNLISVFQKGKRTKECHIMMTKRKGSDINVLNSILNETDTETSYNILFEEDLYETEKQYIRFSKQAETPLSKILNRMKEKSILLGDICDVNNGVFTGGDFLSLNNKNKYKIQTPVGSGIFVITNEELAKMKLNKNELELIKPLFKNSNIHKYYCDEEKKLNLINLRYTDRPNLDDYPNIKKHLLPYKQMLMDRPKTGTLESAFSNNMWYIMSTSRKVNMETEKIVAPQRSKSNTFGYNNTSWYTTGDCFFITEPKKNYSLKFILGLLNSKLYFQWLYNKGKRKGDSLELTQNPLSEIPIPMVNQDNQRDIIELVDQILSAKKQNPQQNTYFLEHQIDLFVYKLY